MQQVDTSSLPDQDARRLIAHNAGFLVSSYSIDKYEAIRDKRQDDFDYYANNCDVENCTPYGLCGHQATVSSSPIIIAASTSTALATIPMKVEPPSSYDHYHHRASLRDWHGNDNRFAEIISPPCQNEMTSSSQQQILPHTNTIHWNTDTGRTTVDCTDYHVIDEQQYLTTSGGNRSHLQSPQYSHYPATAVTDDRLRDYMSKERLPIFKPVPVPAPHLQQQQQHRNFPSIQSTHEYTPIENAFTSRHPIMDVNESICDWEVEMLSARGPLDDSTNAAIDWNIFNGFATPLTLVPMESSKYKPLYTDDGSEDCIQSAGLLNSLCRLSSETGTTAQYSGFMDLSGGITNTTRSRYESLDSSLQEI